MESQIANIIMQVITERGHALAYEKHSRTLCVDGLRIPRKENNHSTSK
jgi:hypothetical protein